MIKLGRALIFIFVLVCTFRANSAMKVQSYLDRNQVALGETVTVTVEVTSEESVEVGDPRFPDLDGFDLLNSWTSQDMKSHLVRSESGGVQFETTRRFRYNYMLAPQRQGRFTLQAFTIVVDGKEYKTAPLDVVVQPSQGGGQLADQDPSTPRGKKVQENERNFRDLLDSRASRSGGYQSQPRNLNEAFFVQVELDKTEVYEGEQILANWYILARGQVERLERLKFPNLKGFWKEDIDAAPQTRFTQEVIQGVLYQKAPIASHALFPINAGTAVIDDFKLKATIRMSSGSFGVFSFGKPYTYTKPSEVVKIKVKPLPTAGKPKDFSGAVGTYKLTAMIEELEVPVGQPISLKVRFEGQGNAKLIDLPPLDVPPAIEVYSTQSKSQYFRTGESFKEFDVVLIPREEGEHLIPPISTAVFNPQTEEYEEKTTESFKLKVIANPNLATGTGESFLDSKPTAAKAAEVVEELIVPPFSVSNDESKADILFKHQQWSPGLYFLALMLALVFGWSQAFAKTASIDYGKVIDERMRDIKALVDKGEWRLAAARASHLTTLILGRLAGLGGGSGKMEELVEALPPAARKAIEKDVYIVVAEAEHVGFAPEDMVKEFAERKKMMGLLSRVEKVLRTLVKAQ